MFDKNGLGWGFFWSLVAEKLQQIRKLAEWQNPGKQSFNDENWYYNNFLIKSFELWNKVRTIFKYSMEILAFNPVLTLIPPSGGLYGLQILLFKVLEVQMC
jgi:hypothetical protein